MGESGDLWCSRPHTVWQSRLPQWPHQAVIKHEAMENSFQEHWLSWIQQLHAQIVSYCISCLGFQIRGRFVEKIHQSDLWPTKQSYCSARTILYRNLWRSEW